MLLEPPVVSLPGRDSVASVGMRRLKDRCEIVRATTQSSAFGGGGTRVFQVVGTYPCDVVARQQNRDDSENQNRQIGLYDVHLPLDANVNLSDRVYVPGYVPPWEPDYSYAAGAYVTPAGGSEVGDGWFYQCVRSGLSGDENPFDAGAAQGALVNDGATLWQRAGRLFVLEPVADEAPNRLNAGSLVVVCKVVT